MMSFGLFKLLGSSVYRQEEIKSFLNSIKKNDEIIISSNGKEIKLSRKEMSPIIDALIENSDKELEKIEAEMIKDGYIRPKEIIV